MAVCRLRYLISLLLLLYFLAGNNLAVFSQNNDKTSTHKSIQKDQINLKVQKVPTKKLNDFKNSDDFDYLFKRAKGFDFWSLLLKWIAELLEGVFSDQGAAPYIRYTIVFLVIAFIIYKIIGGNFSGIFSTNKKIKSQNGFDYLEEDIYEENMDEKLSNAIRKGKFRVATRYYYLTLLKQLDTKKLITWELGKTNRDYQHELKSQVILNDFIWLSGIYEYTWYGHFEVTEERFLKWQQGFVNIFKQI